MRTKLNNKGQANPATTYGRGWLALFTAIFAIAMTFTFNGCGGTFNTMLTAYTAYTAEDGTPVYFDAVLMGDGDKMPAYEIIELPDGKVQTKIDDKILSVSTVKMPDGRVWTAHNLKKITDDSKCGAESKDVDKPTWQKVCPAYGQLYTYEDAKKVCSNFWSPPLPVEKWIKTRGVITKGDLQTPTKEEWHLPTKEEWDALVNSVGDSLTAGKLLKSKYGGWEDAFVPGIFNGVPVNVKHVGAGVDKYRFNAMPTGEGNLDAGAYKFYGVGEYTAWWAYSESNADSAYAYGVGNKHDGVNYGTFPKKSMISVRCIKGPAPTPAPAPVSVPVPAKQEEVPEAVPAQTETPEAGETP
ncbi:MAG: hypothetical protein LBH25_00510 [Fibromonadaceae bacterium]|jgi:uncharacterized protein (TIGR02145 family)|nr:hypothetical protein [Fibromonadaceae bacterium]